MIVVEYKLGNLIVLQGLADGLGRTNDCSRLGDRERRTNRLFDKVDGLMIYNESQY